jgi:23S rRNA (adenine1618-N6)-methyltransferase
LSEEKNILHPRNKHRSRYDFAPLCLANPALSSYIFINKYQNETIDFSIPEAVKALNKALLLHFYNLSYWDIPAQYLCPPIPGRADYIHYMADLLAANNNGIIPKGSNIKVLDVGVGANCIYPIIGHHEYGWHFVGADSNPTAIQSANTIVSKNQMLLQAIDIRLQPNETAIFEGIIQAGEKFSFTMCNPPFHASPEAAIEGSHRKWKNLGIKKDKKAVLNFGGQQAELWCKGGELAFIEKIILQSASFADCCQWFSSLVSKQENLPFLYQALKKVKAIDVKTIAMAQGQKTSRLLAWRFENSPY